jgi:outer membrane scaffolding protein for murein synthesis (MipA/OmpV family)
MNLSVKIKAVLSLLGIILSGAVHAEELRAGLLPQWELGAGLALLHRPDYPGADQDRSYVLPFPYVIYRGERIKADREGLRGMLFEHPLWDLDISAGGSLPVNSVDNRAREGMDDLDFSFEIGPSLRFKLHDKLSQKLHLRLNLRALLALDDFPVMNYQGWVFNPELRWGQRLSYGLTLRANVQMRYGSKAYHDYFYGVPPRFATASRPVYEASTGYNSTGAGLNLRWHGKSNWRVIMSLNYLDLHDASFDDSPLFRKNSGVYFGFSVSRILWRSSVKVDSNP